MRNIIVKDFKYGQIDTLEDRSIPRGAASKALNWRTQADKIELRRGYHLLGNELGSGKITGLFVAKRSDGKEIPFRTRGKKLEYYDADNDQWQEVGSDVLGTDADGKEVSFAEYHSLAGDQLFVNSPYGPFLKIMLANPGSYADMYDANKNYKGYITIKKNRMFLWNRKEDKTGLYLSKIDTENYTTVSAEVIGTGDGNQKTFSATLNFKSGGAKRTCFGVEVTDGVETFRDNYDGTLTGDKGGTGTINYMTGEISVTFNSAVGNGVNVTADYQWEDSTNGGICDFTYSSPRVAGEGVVFRQDDGGIIQSVESYHDIEYCLHEKKTWLLQLTADDTNALNTIYREKAGIPNWRASVPTADGIYYIDTSDDKDPQIRVLRYSGVSEKVLPFSVSKGLTYQKKQVGIDLSNYVFDKAVMKEWGDLILCAFRTVDSNENNRLLVFDRHQKTIDILDYFCSDLAVYQGTLIAGDSFTNNVYTLFSGFDDDDALIGNYWEGNKDDLDYYGLKKVKKLIIKGEIDPDQTLKVYASLDNGSFVEVGEISGNGSYVDKGQEVSIGRNTIGSKEIGGGSEGEYAYPYEREIKLAVDKFGTIKLKFEALGLGYVSVSEWQYKDIRLKSSKIAKKYRST